MKKFRNNFILGTGFLLVSPNSFYLFLQFYLFLKQHSNIQFMYDMYDKHVTVVVD